MSKLDLSKVYASPIDASTKGCPIGQGPLTLRDIANRNWNILRQDVPFPVAVLKNSALKTNSEQMRAFLGKTGASLSPHGKTTMSPQLFDRQLADGAWGLTAATTAHVSAYRNVGAKKIFLANQLVGTQNIRYIVNELENDPDFQFYCLIDSQIQLDLIEEIRDKLAADRSMNVLIEMGAMNGRCGVRAVEQGLALARNIAGRSPAFNLVGIEAFEGVFDDQTGEQSVNVNGILERVVELAQRCDQEGLFSGDELILSAGGSIFYGRAATLFKQARLSRTPTVLLRSGCYLTHDHGFYAESAESEKQHVPPQSYPTLVPALEVWACVQSTPEPGLAILTVGKRDISYDIHLPKPCYHVSRDGFRNLPPGEFEIADLNDQHGFMRCTPGNEPEIGDLIGLGISHPCTTFDKWQLLYLVDDDYNVLEGIKTYF